MLYKLNVFTIVVKLCVIYEGVLSSLQRVEPGVSVCMLWFRTDTFCSKLSRTTSLSVHTDRDPSDETFLYFFLEKL